MIISKPLSKDLTVDILSRLPTKSLCKFRSVCKEWRTIIAEPFFKSLHRARSSKKLFVLVQETGVVGDITDNNVDSKEFRVNISSFEFDGTHKLDFTLTLDGCVDQFLSSKGELICFAGEEGCYICNPSTQQWSKLLPTLPTIKKKRNFSFGYNKERNEYLLVNVFARKPDEHVMGCEVLRWTDGCRLSNCSWKVADAYCQCKLLGLGVLVENVMYWMCECEDDGYVYDEIMSFNLEKEEFESVMPPKGCNASPGDLYLVELKGKLCSISAPFEVLSTMCIWLLSDSNNNVWVKEYTIDLCGLSNDERFLIRVIDYREEKILMKTSSQGRLCCYEYDVESKCFKRIDNAILLGRNWSWWGLYADGLFSLENQF